ncbi:MAG: hypothetical protein HZA53_11440 [Planctomycetes bacterium]|nr:hypothetical protein [Planctomycetota bacterium]
MQPVAAARSERKPAPEALRIERGQHFTYALPPGWRVGEDGQFAVTLIAPDDKALTILVGNAGMPLGYPPEQYVYEKLSALHPDGLRLGAPRAATPASGFERAVEFDVTYSIGGAPCCGVAKWHAAGAYDSATMAMTAALSEEKQWKSYSTWLPSVAEQISALDGAAFGARGVMAQNVQNSTAYAEAARRYREESQRNWQQTTDDRNASVDRRNAQFREDLGAVQAWTNPYDAQKSMELPTTHSYYWIDREGNVVGTDDPSADPNVGSPAEWRSMKRSRP